MGGKVCRTAPDNEKPSSPRFTLACDGGLTMLTYKVILVAMSPTAV